VPELAGLTWDFTLGRPAGDPPASARARPQRPAAVGLAGKGSRREVGGLSVVVLTLLALLLSAQQRLGRFMVVRCWLAALGRVPFSCVISRRCAATGCAQARYTSSGIRSCRTGFPQQPRSPLEACLAILT
jgi:hypothetical protein